MSNQQFLYNTDLPSQSQFVCHFCSRSCKSKNAPDFFSPPKSFPNTPPVCDLQGKGTVPLVTFHHKGISYTMRRTHLFWRSDKNPARIHVTHHEMPPSQGHWVSVTKKLGPVLFLLNDRAYQLPIELRVHFVGFYVDVAERGALQASN